MSVLPKLWSLPSIPIFAKKKKKDKNQRTKRFSHLSERVYAASEALKHRRRSAHHLSQSQDEAVNRFEPPFSLYLDLYRHPIKIKEKKKHDYNKHHCRGAFGSVVPPRVRARRLLLTSSASHERFDSRKGSAFFQELVRCKGEDRSCFFFFFSFLFSSCACALPALSLTPAPSRDARSSVSSQEPSVSYLQGRAILGDGSALGVSLDP